MAAPVCIVPVDHDAVKVAAARFYRHLRRCGQCHLLEERLCKTGLALRDEKYAAVMQKWRR
jgi:flavoprotein